MSNTDAINYPPPSETEFKTISKILESQFEQSEVYAYTNSLIYHTGDLGGNRLFPYACCYVGMGFECLYVQDLCSKKFLMISIGGSDYNVRVSNYLQLCRLKTEVPKNLNNLLERFGYENTTEDILNMITLNYYRSDTIDPCELFDTKTSIK